MLAYFKIDPKPDLSDVLQYFAQAVTEFWLSLPSLTF